MNNFTYSSSRNSKVSAALVGVFSKVPSQSHRLLVFGNDPADRSAPCHRAFEFAKAYPSLSPAGVQPFDQHEIKPSGHFYVQDGVWTRVKLKLPRYGRPYGVPSALDRWPHALRVWMCVRNASSAFLCFYSEPKSKKQQFHRHGTVDFKLGHYHILRWRQF